MRSFFYIFLLALLYLVCSARSCNEDGKKSDSGEDSLVMQARDSIRQAVEGSVLSKQSLSSYETSATLKLKNLFEYLKIIGDSSLDISFRKKAGQMATGLFYRDDTKISEFTKLLYGKSYTNPGEWVKAGLENQLYQSYTMDTSWVLLHLQESNDSTFTGKLAFNIKEKEHQSLQKNPFEISVYLIRRSKSFGKDIIQSWDICLGEISEDN